MPPKFSIVARWWPFSYERMTTWEDCSHYILLGPTGPRERSFWAIPTGAFVADKRKVRVTQVTDPGTPLLTEVEYKARFEQKRKDYEHEKLLKILTQRF